MVTVQETEGAGPVGIDELRWRHEAVLDAQRPVTVAKQRARHELTARERISLLLDEGEALLESGALVRPADPDFEAAADGVVIGLGRVHGRLSVVVACDYTVLGGTHGQNNLAKLSRAMVLAGRYDAPLFILAEGGGARTQELNLPKGANTLGVFEQLARLSGRVPLIGVALGRVFAGHAILLGECDTIIATERSAIGVAGPPLVKASTGEDLTPEELGGARIHEVAGAAERIAADDAEAIELARSYSDFFARPAVDYQEERAGIADGLRALAFGEEPRDTPRLIELVADAGSLFELRPTWSTEVITTLARMGGRSVGIVATNASVGGGALTAPGCDKIARFVALCDAFALPILLLVDTVGTAGGPQARGQALFRHAARIPIAFSDVRVPVVTFLIGRVGGVTQALLGGFGRFLEGPPHFMWPTAKVEGLGVGPVDPAGSPLRVAEQYVTDDVIDPGDTRRIALHLLAATPPVAARHALGPIDPW